MDVKSFITLTPDIILTRPLAPKNVRVEDVTSNTCILAWAVLPGADVIKLFTSVTYECS
jgi:hypothetical protein